MGRENWGEKSGAIKVGREMWGEKSGVRKVGREKRGRQKWDKKSVARKRTPPLVYRSTVAPPTPSAGGQGRHPRESQRLVDSLKSTASGLTPAKQEANSSIREATQVSGSTSSGTHAARRGECSDRPLANCASHNRRFTSKAVMCACMSVTRMSMPCRVQVRSDVRPQG